MYLQIFLWGAGRCCCDVLRFGSCVLISCFFRGKGLVFFSRWFLVTVPAS